MFDTICKVRATSAFDSGSIGSEQDYQPTRNDLRTIVAQMFAIVTRSSPGASQWVANITPETLLHAEESFTHDSDQMQTSPRAYPSSSVGADRVTQDAGYAFPSVTERPQSKQGLATYSAASTGQEGSSQIMAQVASSNMSHSGYLPAYMPVTVMMLPGSYTQFSIPSLNPVHLMVAAPVNYPFDGSFPPLFEIPQAQAPFPQMGLQGLPVTSFNDISTVPNNQNIVLPGVGEAMPLEQDLDFDSFLNEPPVEPHT
jgi:hypothetical protein